MLVEKDFGGALEVRVNALGKVGFIDFPFLSSKAPLVQKIWKTISDGEEVFYDKKRGIRMLWMRIN